MHLRISDDIRDKLRHKHRVDEQDILECFSNRERRALIDDREDHRSDPPTHWFIAETNHGRTLLVAYIPRADSIHIRTAFAPSAARQKLYRETAPLLDPGFDDP